MSNVQGGAGFRAGELVVESYRTLGKHWRDCLVALALPSVIDTLVRGAFMREIEAMQQQEMTTEQVLEQMVGEDSLFRLVAMLLVNVIAITLFAVSWHRLSLLGEKPRLLPRIGSEHMRFAFLSLALIFATTLIALSGVTLAASATAGLVVLFAMILVVVIYLKLSMMFPAAALDQPCTVAQSWRMTKGSAFTLFWALVLGIIPMFFALMLLGMIIASVIAGLLAGSALGDWIYLLIQAALSYLPWAVTIGIVSLAYRRLVGTNRPAGAARGSHGA